MAYLRLGRRTSLLLMAARALPASAPALVVPCCCEPMTVDKLDEFARFGRTERHFFNSVFAKRQWYEPLYTISTGNHASNAGDVISLSDELSSLVRAIIIIRQLKEAEPPSPAAVPHTRRRYRMEWSDEYSWMETRSDETYRHLYEENTYARVSYLRLLKVVRRSPIDGTGMQHAHHQQRAC